MVFSAKEVFGNQGVAVAALLTNYLIDTVGWRSSYFVPGAFSVLIGIGYMLFIRGPDRAGQSRKPAAAELSGDKALLIGVFAFPVFCVAAFVIFVAVFCLPKTRKI